MFSLGLKALGPAFLALSQLAAAIPNNVEPRLLGGVCQAYGGYLQSSTGNGFVGNVAIRPANTDTFLDTFQPSLGSNFVSQRGGPGYNYMAWYNVSDVAGYAIQCFDEEGLVERTSGKPLRISTDFGRDAQLVYKSYGLIPEAYAHYIDGVKQDGVYLGINGHTTWAFSQVTSNGVPMWKPRLLINVESGTDAGELRAGEFAGFLKARFA